jgi:hypothetical protein
MDIQSLLDEISKNTISKKTDARLFADAAKVKYTLEDILPMYEELKKGIGINAVSSKYGIHHNILTKYLRFYKLPELPKLHNGGMKTNLQAEQDIINGMTSQEWCDKWNKTKRSYEGMKGRAKRKGLL